MTSLHIALRQVVTDFIFFTNEGFARNLLVLLLSSLLLIRAQEISGVSTQVMTLLTALLILSKILHIRYCYILWVICYHILATFNDKYRVDFN